MKTRRRPFGDQLEFLRQWRREFDSTGAILPSSRFLAQAITRPLEQHAQPVRILEVGPGTGAVTRRIVELLQADDRLDLVELNGQFVEILEGKFREDPIFRAAAGRAEIHSCALQKFEADGQYDYIVSGLPLNNFPPEVVREIFEVCFGLLKPGGVLSYFEYMFVRRLRRAVSGGSERTRLSDLNDVLGSYLSRHRFRTTGVLANVPPAWVHHLRGEGGGDQP
jgi:phosphatidylethanolamine/phosphatidyl-N-methylethanolamine N-methyltransferase